MTKVILVRQGETDWSNIGRIQGGVDVPLNSRGMEQARNLASTLSGEKIKAVFSSQLSRSYTTAEEIARPHKLKVKRLKELNELNQGLWQGLLLSEVKKRYKKQYNLWRQDPTLVQPPKGESLREACDRAVNTVQKIADKYPDDTVCIVSHEIISGLIKGYYSGLDIKELWKFSLKKAQSDVIEIKKA